MRNQWRACRKVSTKMMESSYSHLRVALFLTSTSTLNLTWRKVLVRDQYGEEQKYVGTKLYKLENVKLKVELHVFIKLLTIK